MSKTIRRYKPAWPYFRDERRDLDLDVIAVYGGDKYGKAVLIVHTLELPDGSTVELGTALSEKQVLDLVMTLLRRLKGEKGYSSTDWGVFEVIDADGETVDLGFG